MEPTTFLDWVTPHAKALQAKYQLDAWRIRLQVVSDQDLDPKYAAEVKVREEYRSATILFAETLVREADERVLLDVLDHEFQHVFLHPLEALKNLVLDAVPPDLKGVINNEFYRANERVRASLERLLEHHAARRPAFEVSPVRREVA